MVESSVIPCKGCSPWKGFLLMVSILICCHLTTTSKVTIESVPFDVFKGDNVLLKVHNLPEDILAFAWFKGLINLKHRIAFYALNSKSTILAPAYRSRETVYHNGSLQIYNVTKKDTGPYTLHAVNREGRVVSRATFYLRVYSSRMTCGCPPTCAKLTVELVPPSVAEGDSVLLLVHNLPEKLLATYWFKSVILFSQSYIGRHIIGMNSSDLGPAHSGRETLYSNGSLLIHNVTWKDTGFYTLQTVNRDIKMELLRVHLKVENSLSAGSNSVMIEQVPPNAVEGNSVLFQVHHLPEDLKTFSWYKGVIDRHNFQLAEYNSTMNSVTRGLGNSGREIVYTNGSLLLQDVTEKNSDFYTLYILNGDLKKEMIHVRFHMFKPVKKPNLWVGHTNVTEQSSVVFGCISADTGVSIRWIFNNESLKLTERMTLSPMKCRLRINSVMMEDSGEYKCEVSNPVSLKTSLPVRLTVVN